LLKVKLWIVSSALAIKRNIIGLWRSLRVLIAARTPRSGSITRLALIKESVVDNEKELYVGAIRRLEMELERAHERGDRLERLLLQNQGRVSSNSDKTVEQFEPIRPSGMSMREAARRVREFEEQILASKKDEPDAGEISETIQTDANRASRGGSDRQGFAV